MTVEGPTSLSPAAAIEGKRVSVVGLGRSGLESSLFLASRGYRVFASDGGESSALAAAASSLRDKGIEVETGGHTLDRILDSDWAILSPGIAPHTPVFDALRAASIPMFSEVEVSSWFAPPGKVIGVTGSCAKTTVTTLIYRALRKSGCDALLCGNIGNPWIGELRTQKPGQTVILELSSFQLALCQRFRPDIGVLLNVTENHLDWHPDMGDYVASKLRLFQNQTADDFSFFRSCDRELFFPDFPFRSKVCFFDPGEGPDPNQDVVREVALLAGAQADAIEEVFRGFEGLSHRMEVFLESRGIRYVNDSKATTTASLAWALKKQRDGSVILIAGGHPKSSDFEQVSALLGRKARKVFLIGEAAPLMLKVWGQHADCETVERFEDAVAYSVRLAREGETVLLSPACSSFDMFRNYVDRGERFKAAVCTELGVSSPLSGSAKA